MKRGLLQFGIADVLRLTASLCAAIAGITASRGPLPGKELAIGATIFVVLYVSFPLVVRLAKRLIDDHWSCD